MSAPDFLVEDHGSIVVFQPMTSAARDFVDQYVDVPSWAWMGGGFAVDHRMAGDLVFGIVDEFGMTVEGE